MMPERIGPYQIKNEIGRGGMAIVYRAWDIANRREVALKVLSPYLAQDQAFLKRFIREGRNAERLRHPNVVRIYDAGEADGFHYIALEYINGGSLADRLERCGGPLPPDQALSIVSQVATGLDYAHDCGFLHRDIKPGNILLTRDGRALISDFGIAKQLAGDMTAVTLVGYSMGTPAYMAPEQARGDEQINRCADIYSLGVVAYAMLTGCLPFQAESQLALLRKIIEEPPPPPISRNSAIPPGMAQALTRGLAKDPDARYATAGEFARALTTGRTQMPVQAAHMPLPTIPVKPPVMHSKRRRAASPTREAPRLPSLVIVVVAGALIALALATITLVAAQLSVALPARTTPGPASPATPAPLPHPTVTETLLPAAGLPPTAVSVTKPSPSRRSALPRLTPQAAAVFYWQPIAQIYEDFEHPTTAWPTMTSNASHWRLQDGMYRLTVRTPRVIVRTWRGVVVGDFTVAFDAKTLHDRPDLHCGVLFRGNGADDFYQLDFSPGFGYELMKQANGKSEVLISRRPIPSRRVTDLVRLSVSARGAQIQVAVDDLPPAEVTDDTFSRGDLALYGASGAQADAEFAFDNYAFTPASSEAVATILQSYADPAHRFVIFAPTDWITSTDEYGVSFDSPDRLARVFIHQVPGVLPDDPPAEVARKYTTFARTTFQKVVEGESRLRQVGGREIAEQRLTAQVLGVSVQVRLIALNDDGYGLVAVSAAAVSREPVLRPLLDYILESFLLGEPPAIAQGDVVLTVTAPEGGAVSRILPPLTATPLPGASPAQDVNVRQGPGTDYPVIGAGLQGQHYTITGKNAQGDWWQINFNGRPGWLRADLVKLRGDLSAIGVVASIPSPIPPTPLPPPTPDAPAGSPSAELRGRIAYSIWEAASNTYLIMARGMDGSAPSLIYRGATQPDFCVRPYNRIIANGFSAGLEGTVVIDLDGGVREVIPNTRDKLPACSPDGQRVTFETNREGEWQIWLHRDINVRDDNASYKLGPSYFGHYPTWSSRWQVIWQGCNFWSGNGGDCGLWQVPDTGRGTPVRISTGGSDTAPDASPDGSGVAYMSRETGRWQVFTASANGGDNRQLTQEGDSGLPTWAPDGQAIAFVSNRDGRWGLWVMDVDGRHQRRIAALEPAFGQGPIDWTEQRISWGP